MRVDVRSKHLSAISMACVSFFSLSQIQFQAEAIFGKNLLQSISHLYTK